MSARVYQPRICIDCERVYRPTGPTQKRCDVCARTKVQEHNRRYREENREKVLEYKRRYYEENREKLLEYKRRYYEENREKLLEYNLRYYEENREKYLEYALRYREENREKYLECKRRYEWNRSLELSRSERARALRMLPEMILSMIKKTGNQTQEV